MEGSALTRVSLSDRYYARIFQQVIKNISDRKVIITDTLSTFSLTP
jgi:hypothetical protein